jgi:hypothetical protein
MSQAVMAQDVATDPHLDPQVRCFLVDINKNASEFWELPHPQPQDILTGLQNKTPVDLSNVTTTERSMSTDGHTFKLRHEATPCGGEARRAAVHPRGRVAGRQFREPPAAIA